MPDHRRVGAVLDPSVVDLESVKHFAARRKTEESE